MKLNKESGLKSQSHPKLTAAATQMLATTSLLHLSSLVLIRYGKGTITFITCFLLTVTTWASMTQQ